MGEEREQSRSGVHRQDKAEGKASRQSGRACSPFNGARQALAVLPMMCCRLALRGAELPISQGYGRRLWWPWRIRVAVSPLQIPGRSSPNLAAFH